MMSSAVTIHAPTPAESWDDDFIFTLPSAASSSRTPPYKNTPSPARSKRSRGSIPRSDGDWDSPRSVVVENAALPVSGVVGSEEREDIRKFGRKISLKSLNESAWDMEPEDEVVSGKMVLLEHSRSRIDELHQPYRELAPALPINSEISSPRKDHTKTITRTPTLPSQPSESTPKAKDESRHARKKSFPLPFSSPSVTPRSSSMALATTRVTRPPPPPPPPPKSLYPTSLSSGKTPKPEAFLSRVSSRLSKRFSTSGMNGGFGSGAIKSSTPRVQPRHGVSASVGGESLASLQTPHHQMKRITSHIQPQHSYPEEDPESSTSRQVSLTSATTNDSSDAIRTPSPYTGGKGSVTAYADSRIPSSTSEIGNGIYRLATSPSLTSMKFHLPSPSPVISYASTGGPTFHWGHEVEAERAEEVPKRTGQGSTAGRYMAQKMEPRPSQDSLVRSSISSRSDDTMDLGTALKTWTFGVGNKSNMERSTEMPSKERSRKTSMLSTHRQSTDSVRRPPLAGEQDMSGSNSAIKRITSLSWKHRRKISDGWKIVSGAKPKATTSTSVANEVDQVDPSTPRARRSVQYLPSVAGTPSPRLTLTESTRLGVPLPLRSSSHNGTPASTDTRVEDNDNQGHSPRSFRRSSLGDLRIPSRVVSAQKGIREGVGMIKQFAAGVKDLQALMQQRILLELALTGETLQDASIANTSPAHDSIMHQSPERSDYVTRGVTDQVKALEREYGDWWDMAEMLITLADTGSAEDPVEEHDDIKKGRRVTVAAPSTTGSLAGSSEFPTAEVASRAWRATTGRQTLSQRQLAVLQGVLSTPSSPGKASLARSTVQPIARDHRRNITVNSRGQAPPPPPPVSSAPRSRPLESSRRSSRSGLFGFKDILRGGPSSDNLASPATPTAFNQTKSPRRPSLANIFRRSSSNFDSPAIQERPSPPQIRRTPDGSPGGASVTSTLSDWDRLDSPINASTKLRTPSPEPHTFPRRPTHMSGIAGKSANMSDLTVRTGSPHLQIPAPTSTEIAEDAKGIPSPAFILTPDNLPGLVKYLSEVTIHCKENVAGLEHLKARVRR